LFVINDVKPFCTVEMRGFKEKNIDLILNRKYTQWSALVMQSLINIDYCWSDRCWQYI